jgi:hypothetical protein
LGVLEDTSLTSQQRVTAEANLELELWKTKDPDFLKEVSWLEKHIFHL